MNHILVVEDENAVRGALRRLLERHGFKVSEAGSVQEASDNFDLEALDVIISDLRLPGLPGTELIKRTATPVLIMTSYASLRSAIDSMKIGAVDYLSKPADADDVVAALLALEGRKADPPDHPMSADRVRWEHIQRIYELCGRNVSETARRLNMHRHTLQRILAKRAPR